MRLACAKPHVRNSPDGPDSCEITRAITLVHLTTGTFNHFVKDPIALRLSGAFQVPLGLPRKETLELLETCCLVAQALLPVLHSGFSSEPQVAKTRRDEPFKLTPSGCFLSMWIS